MKIEPPEKNHQTVKYQNSLQQKLLGYLKELH